MESEARYVLVGSFVLISILLITVAILWLSDTGGAAGAKFYTVYFKEHTLDGLQKDSDVTMKGIKVGSVYDYSISPRSVEEVKVVLRLDGETPVKANTKAALRRNLLTGLGWIDLVGSTEQSPLLVNTPPGEDYPVIPEGRTQIERLAESIPEVLEHIAAITQRIEKVVSDENLKSLERSLRNIEATTGAFAESKDEFQRVLKNLDQVLVNVKDSSDNLEEFSKTATQTAQNINTQTAETLKKIEDAAAGIETETQAISGSVQNAAIAFSQEMTVLSQRVGAAADSFAKTAEGFENPRAIITGPQKQLLGPGEELTK